MNCWKGVCKYKTENSDLCTRDVKEGKEPKKCDMKHEPQYHDVCRYGRVSCEDCYAYSFCTET